jgi:hypothetical protein
MLNSLLKLLLITLCLWLIHGAWQEGYADVTSSALQQYHKRWNQGELADRENSRLAADLATTLLRLAPNNPYYLNLVAKNHEWLAYFAQSSSLTLPVQYAESHLQQAAQLYQDAITQRPTWAETHRHLAKLGWRQAQPTELVYASLVQANRWAPFDPENQTLFLHFGLTHWQQLLPQQRADVAKQLFTAPVRLPKYQFEQIIRQHHDLSCLLLNSASVETKLCQ